MFTIDPTLLVALAVVVKATALLGIAAIMQLVVFRRASAATRHLVWTFALVSVLLLPSCRWSGQRRHRDSCGAEARVGDAGRDFRRCAARDREWPGVARHRA